MADKVEGLLPLRERDDPRRERAAHLQVRAERGCGARVGVGGGGGEAGAVRDNGGHRGWNGLHTGIRTLRAK